MLNNPHSCFYSMLFEMLWCTFLHVFYPHCLSCFCLHLFYAFIQPFCWLPKCMMTSDAQLPSLSKTLHLELMDSGCYTIGLVMLFTFIYASDFYTCFSLAFTDIIHRFIVWRLLWYRDTVQESTVIQQSIGVSTPSATSRGNIQKKKKKKKVIFY